MCRADHLSRGVLPSVVCLSVSECVRDTQRERETVSLCMIRYNSNPLHLQRVCRISRTKKERKKLR